MLFMILFGLFDLILSFVCQICHVNCETEKWKYQIAWFIGLWATFYSLWQQLICPNLQHLRQFFKGVKIYHFSSEIIFGQLL